MKAGFTGVRRVLAIKFRLIGDVLLTIPAMKALRSTFPEADIHMLVPEGTQEVVQYHPVIDRVLTFKRDKKNQSLWRKLVKEKDLLRVVRDGKYDLTVNFTEGDRGALLSFLSAARYRIGYDPGGRGFPGQNRLYTHLGGRMNWDLHVVDMGQSLLSRFGVRGGDGTVDLYYPEGLRSRVRDLLWKNGLDPDEKTVVVHPTSRWMYKAWSTEGNAAVVDWLQDHGVQVIITCGPDDTEREMVAEISSLCASRPCVFPGTLSLLEFAALLDTSVAFFGVDSAPMHMAAALGVPSAAIFGPTKELNWRPFGEGHLVIASDDSCRPCDDQGCDGSMVSDCIVNLSPAAVIAQLEQWLVKWS
jgi:heptosyltransferase-3